MAELLPVEQQIAQTLQAGHALTVRWNCGSDESFVYTQLDGQELEADYGNDNDLAYLLDQYLTARLELPSSGQFFMAGTGRIFLTNRAAVLEFQSAATSYVDNPDGWLPEEYLSCAELAELCPERLQPGAPDPEQLLALPDSQLAAAYTGRQVLFPLLS